MDWQPMETAPKGGSRILLGYEDETREGWWHAAANPPCALWRTDSGRPVMLSYPKGWMAIPTLKNADDKIVNGFIGKFGP